MEEWRDIIGYDCKYQISNLGNVRSARKVLKKQLDRYGYFFVNLYLNGKSKHKKVHRLVAQAFISGYSDSLQINHKNEVKTDNRVENLELCNNKYNCNYGSRRTVLAKPVIQETLNGEFVREWESTNQIERELGFKHTAVSSCCNGYLKDYHSRKIYPVHNAYGYKWRYKYDSKR